jgi:hypothetical protein
VNLADLRADVAGIVEAGVVDVTVYDRVPDSIVTPCAIVMLTSATPADTSGGELVAGTIYILESRADTPSAQTRLDDYLEDTKAALDSLEADTRWAGWEGYHARYTFNGVEYVGVQVNFETAR